MLHSMAGMRSPDRGSTTGAASWTDCEHSEQAARRASEASQSPPHRHILRRARTQVRAFFSHIAQPGGDEKPGPGFDYWRSQLDRLRAQRTGCPQGERSESIPASPPYLKKSSYASTGFFFVCYTAWRGYHPAQGFRSTYRW